MSEQLYVDMDHADAREMIAALEALGGELDPKKIPHGQTIRFIFNTLPSDETLRRICAKAVRAVTLDITGHAFVIGHEIAPGQLMNNMKEKP